MLQTCVRFVFWYSDAHTKGIQITIQILRITAACKHGQKITKIFTAFLEVLLRKNPNMSMTEACRKACVPLVNVVLGSRTFKNDVYMNVPTILQDEVATAVARNGILLAPLAVAYYQMNFSELELAPSFDGCHANSYVRNVCTEAGRLLSTGIYSKLRYAVFKRLCFQ